MSRIDQSGRMSLRRPKPPIKGSSAPEEEEEEDEEEEEEDDDGDDDDDDEEEEEEEGCISVFLHLVCPLLCCHPCPFQQMPYFFALFHKRHNFRKKNYWT